MYKNVESLLEEIKDLEERLEKVKRMLDHGSAGLLKNWSDSIKVDNEAFCGYLNKEKEKLEKELAPKLVTAKAFDALLSNKDN